MRQIICHQCQTEQSSARDVCMECGAFMKRQPENFVGAAAVTEKVWEKLPQPPRLTEAVVTPAYVASGLAADTPMICCHACYAVQLAEERICGQCGKVMDRRASYLFPANQLTQPYQGRLPKAQQAVATQAPPHEATQETTAQPKQAIAQAAPSATEAPAVGNQRICCHKCFAVQAVANRVCEQCKTFMQRDPQYIFVAK